MLPEDKPHFGRIAHARKIVVSEACEKHLGYYYRCMFRDHPEYASYFGWTSMVVNEVDGEVETLNSRYTICEI